MVGRSGPEHLVFRCPYGITGVTKAEIAETQVKIEKSRSSNLRWTVGLLLGVAITNSGTVFGAAPALIRVFG